MQPLRSYRSIFFFWSPLAAQWVMMAAEGPFLAAVIARMGDAAFNLAAYGVSFAVAILVESPVIMLMSAATALAEDAASYRRLRAFTAALNAGSTALLLLVLVPPVFRWTMLGVLGLPEAVGELVYGALWLLLPWPAAIGYRRFLHGVLIRSGRTRLVAYGTVLRLAAMAATALALHLHGGLPGAWVGAAALSAGVCVEALAARFMAAGAVRELLGSGTRVELGYGDIARFYFPLALTSLIGLTVHPLLTFFMGRAPFPVESLAVFPVVHGLSFLFRAPGFAFQETVIALAGRRLENVPVLARFGAVLGASAAGGLALVAFTPLAVFPVVHGLSFLFRAPGFAFQETVIALAGRRLENVPVLARFGAVLGASAAGGLALVAFTPLASVWFQGVSGLPADLAAFAVVPTRLLAPLPIVAVAIAFQHALLVHGRTTRAVTVGTAVEVAGIALLFVVFGWRMGMVGVSAASVALLGGRLFSAGYLAGPVRRVLRGGGAARTA